MGKNNNYGNSAYRGQEFYDSTGFFIVALLVIAGFTIVLAQSLFPVFLFLFLVSLVGIFVSFLLDSETLRKWSALAAFALLIGLILTFAIGNIFAGTPIGQTGVQLYNATVETVTKLNVTPSSS